MAQLHHSTRPNAAADWSNLNSEFLTQLYVAFQEVIPCPILTQKGNFFFLKNLISAPVILRVKWVIFAKKFWKFAYIRYLRQALLFNTNTLDSIQSAIF